ncbi:importin alpha [Anaeramoeba ignava]|uniref:Importin subunit alpha n=1 Tax=Anaeramoeba ignava TaxID=1746090 RepID=A0A9Q0LED1_ANAIG|nr:importin alpha [Anaeramoeba ignava]
MSYRKRIERRKSNFKSKIDLNEARGKRHQQVVQLSKTKKEEFMMKKRNIFEKDSNSDSEDQSDDAIIQDLQNYVNLVKSESVHDINSGLYYIRKLVSAEVDPPIQEANDSQIQFESAWILTNIASGTKEQTHQVVESGAIPHFVNLLLSEDTDVQEQSVWAIGNIAGDHVNYRDMLIKLDVVPKILALIPHIQTLDMLRNILWAISNLCRGRPKADFSKTMFFLPLLSQFLTHPDTQILIHATTAISYLTNGPDDDINVCVKANIVTSLVKLLSTQHFKILTPTLRAIGNIVSGTDEHTNSVLDCNPLPTLFQLLSNPHNFIRKEVCWIISNITAGTEDQIMKVLLVDHLFVKLLEIIQNDAFEIKKEAIWAVSNSITGGTNDQIRWMVQQNCIKPICDMLNIDDPKIVGVCLDALQTILEFGDREQTNAYANYLEEIGAPTIFASLTQSQNDGIYEKASEMLYLYFSNDESETNFEDQENIQESNESKQNNFQL